MKKKVILALLVICSLTALTHADVKIDSAIDFSLKDAKGVTHNLYEYLDAGKWVLLSFTGKS